VISFSIELGIIGICSITPSASNNTVALFPLSYRTFAVAQAPGLARGLYRHTNTSAMQEHKIHINASLSNYSIILVVLVPMLTGSILMPSAVFISARAIRGCVGAVMIMGGAGFATRLRNVFAAWPGNVSEGKDGHCRPAGRWRSRSLSCQICRRRKNGVHDGDARGSGRVLREGELICAEAVLLARAGDRR